LLDRDVFITLDGPQAHDNSGGDDKGERDTLI